MNACQILSPMRKLFYLTLLCFGCITGVAQNLVPNGDFEQYDGCNFLLGDLDSAAFWFNPTNSTPDYFNECVMGAAGIPSNYFGYQYAHTGTGCGGIYIWFGGSNNYREYMEVPLTAPLVANQCYQLRMWVNLANSVKYTSHMVGAYFSDTLIDVSTYYVLPFVPQIQNSAGTSPDSLFWTFISQTFTANGGENYMIIGNFLNDSSTILTVANNNISTSNDSACYFYIDNVCLTPCGASCLTGIDEYSAGYEVKIYPNPASEIINIDYPVNGVLEIINTLGQTMIKTETSAINKKVSVDVRNLPPGIYSVRGKDFSGRFLKE